MTDTRPDRCEARLWRHSSWDPALTAPTYQQEACQPHWANGATWWLIWARLCAFSLFISFHPTWPHLTCFSSYVIISTHSSFIILLPLLSSLYSRHHVLTFLISLLPSFHYVFLKISQSWIYPTIASPHYYPVGFWMLLEVHSRSQLGIWLSLPLLAWASLCPPKKHSPQPSGPLQSPCLTFLRWWPYTHLAEKLEIICYETSSLNLLSSTRLKSVIFAFVLPPFIQIWPFYCS